MKKAIELARSRERRTEELAAEARYARERYDLYKAKAYGPRMTSPARLRTLQHAAEAAELRLRRAQEAPDPSLGADLPAPDAADEAPEERHP